MNRLQIERTAESNTMRRHLPDRVRRVSSRNPNSRIVKQNDFMIGCEPVRYRGIPTIHVGVEVLQKEQRNRPRFAETTVGIADSFGFNKLCRDRFVGVIAHSNTPSVSALFIPSLCD